MAYTRRLCERANRPPRRQDIMRSDSSAAKSVSLIVADPDRSTLEAIQSSFYAPVYQCIPVSKGYAVFDHVGAG